MTDRYANIRDALADCRKAFRSLSNDPAHSTTAERGEAVPLESTVTRKEEEGC